MVAKKTAKKTAEVSAKAPTAKAPARKTSTAKAPARKTSTATATKRKTSTAKAPERKTSTAGKAAPEKTAPAGKAPAAEKTAAKPAVKRPVAKKSVAKRPAAKKTVGKKAAVRKPAAKKVPAKKAAAKKAAVRKPAAKKTVPGGGGRGTGTMAVDGTAAGPRTQDGPVAPGELMVRPGEEPWTTAEADEARAGLSAEAVRLHSEIRHSEAAVSGMMRDSGDGAGDDQADVGTKTISREHEMSLAENAREMLRQTERALGRLDDGTYGRCESCGSPIGKARMQAFPRATLCVECKQRSERR